MKIKTVSFDGAKLIRRLCSTLPRGSEMKTHFYSWPTNNFFFAFQLLGASMVDK